MMFRAAGHRLTAELYELRRADYYAHKVGLIPIDPKSETNKIN